MRTPLSLPDVVAVYEPYLQPSGGNQQLLVDRGVDRRHGNLGSAKGAMIDEMGLVTPGVDLSNHATAPDSAALSITGDIDIRLNVAPAAWANGSNQSLAGKYNGNGNQRTWWMTLGGTAALSLWISPDGVAVVNFTSSTAVPGVNGEALWVRAALDVDNGAAQKECRFYTSPDGVTWTQLGSTIVSAGATSLFDSTALQEIGYGNGTLFKGTILACQIRSGIDGTVAFDADFSAQPLATTSFVESSANGATVTVKISAADANDPSFTGSALSFGADDYVDRDTLLLWGADFTVMAVVDAAAQLGKVICGESSSASASPAWALMSDATAGAKGRFRLTDDAGDVLLDVVTHEDVFDGEPHSIAASYDAGSRLLSLYVDGRLSTTGAVATSTSATLDRATIGAKRSTSTTDFFTGLVHAVAQYQRVLSAGEIAEIHAYYHDQLAAEGVSLPSIAGGNPWPGRVPLLEMGVAL